MYRLLGARWYAGGLYVKDVCDGSEIRADKLYRVEVGDFVYNRLFAWKGSFASVNDAVHGCYVSTEFPCFRPKLDRLHPQFLQRFMSRETAWNEALGLSTGGTPTSRNRLKEEGLLGMSIPLPSMEEQRRIVARVDQLAAKISEARTIRVQAAQQANTLFGRIIAELFTSSSNNGWKHGVLGDYVQDDCYGTSEKTTDDDSGTPILRMGNIQDGRLTLHDLKYLHIAAKERDKLVLKRGDIVVNRTNSAELVGKCAVFNLDEEFGFASYLIRLRLDRERAVPELVAAYINSPAGRAYMFNERKQMTGQANVNATKLRALPIALPPLAEQRQIVSHLDNLSVKVDSLKLQQQQSSAELIALLPSVLDRAFKGSL
jgi:type I restriction enzyme S subunit